MCIWEENVRNRFEENETTRSFSAARALLLAHDHDFVIKDTEMECVDFLHILPLFWSRSNAFIARGNLGMLIPILSQLKAKSSHLRCIMMIFILNHARFNSTFSMAGRNRRQNFLCFPLSKQI